MKRKPGHEEEVLFDWLKVKGTPDQVVYIEGSNKGLKQGIVLIAMPYQKN